MKSGRLMRLMMAVAAGCMTFQLFGCDANAIDSANQFVQTVLLGITAAGSIAILQNI